NYSLRCTTKLRQRWYFISSAGPSGGSIARELNVNRETVARHIQQAAASPILLIADCGVGGRHRRQDGEQLLYVLHRLPGFVGALGEWGHTSAGSQRENKGGNGEWDKKFTR